MAFLARVCAHHACGTPNLLLHLTLVVQAMAKGNLDVARVHAGVRCPLL